MAPATSSPESRSCGRSSRPSQSQPHHRRPGWARNERAYHRYIENPPDRPRNQADVGYDNFTYDQAHLAKSMMPKDLLFPLPPPLHEPAKLYVLAYAAVHTAYERIEALDKESPGRGNPESSHKHLVSHRIREGPATLVGAEATPPSITLSTLTPALSNSFNADSKKLLMQMPPQLPVNMMGMESPPFTPVDSKVANTPVNELLHGNSASNVNFTDLANHVTTKLTRTNLTPSTSHESAEFTTKNEIAYQFYVNQFNAEINDIKSHAFKRVEGYDRMMTRQFFELVHDDELTPKQEAALQEFKSWWTSMKTKIAELKTRVMALEEKAVGSTDE